MHTYRGTQIVVTFDKDTCIHSGNCVKGLPAVFNIKKQPWVSPDAAQLAVVISQIQ